ncbi:ArsR/SmtB family transcription factor [Actinomadura bangladeshensis]|uniref:Transcriptional regulator n=1 Tax=Actinomadura bangladeshensis TaxID=453573 RepID=A0A4R4PCG9_9ACTN|nr:transcriptional regulator [Actinomadura bangladeshensis]
MMSVQTDVLKLLADPLRAQIVSLLAVEALCNCHLVEETGARQTNISNHLRALREAGLVDTEPCGRFTYYRLRPEALERLASELGELAAGAREAQTRRRKRPCT